MARFFFGFVTDRFTRADDEGIDLPDLQAAAREAELAARELLADAIKANKSRVPDAVVIMDQSGARLHTIALAALLPDSLNKVR
jgi:hypothetical protein